MLEEHELAEKASDLDLVLTFLLTWFGWLSREQGALAKIRGLAVAEGSMEDDIASERLRLTEAGYKVFHTKIFGPLNIYTSHDFARHLQNADCVSLDRYYLSALRPLRRMSPHPARRQRKNLQG